MRKFYFGLVVLLLIALVPIASAGVAVVKTTGGGWFVSGGDKLQSTWTAQMDGQGNVKGQAESHHVGEWDIFHVDITSLIVSGQYAYIGGVVTHAPDPAQIGTEMCMCIYDGGKGETDYISDWWYGSGKNAAFCQANYYPWAELLGGNAKVF